MSVRRKLRRAQHAGHRHQQQEAGEEHADDGEHATCAAQLALVERVHLVLERIALGPQCFDVVSHRLSAPAGDPAGGGRETSTRRGSSAVQAMALDLSCSNSAWVMAPESSSSLAWAISAAAPPLPAVSRT